MEGWGLFFIIGLSFCGASPVDSGEKTALQCGEREAYTFCVQSGCVAQNCSQLGQPVACVRLDPKFCREGCVCKEEYLRDEGGECVKKDQCKEEPCPGPNEYFSCGGACDNVCATLREQSQNNCPIRNIRCNDMCYCDEGYARDAGGTCIPIDDCTQ